jgi:5,10-methylenetetrahydromethanopterin reductase
MWITFSQMDIGVCIASKIDDIDHGVLAEQLGYCDLWVADSQLLWSDCYATMALLADRTDRIRIGTGVAVAGTRAAAVTAAAHATINQIAPGRVFCGIGTGNTAMRIMGRRPLNIAGFDRYLRELRALMDGRPITVETSPGDAASAVEIRHLMPDAGFVAFEPRIPMYVSAFGPRAMGLAVRHGDGLVTSVPPHPGAIKKMWSRLEEAADTEGRLVDPDSFPTATLTTICVMQPGETSASERVREYTGAFAMAAMHYQYEQWREAGRPVQRAPFPMWDEYVAMLDSVDPAKLNQRIHLGHNCWVIPEEERFVTPELIERTCIIGTVEQITSQIRELKRAGLSQIMLLPPLAVRDQVLREVAAEVMPLVN